MPIAAANSSPADLPIIPDWRIPALWFWMLTGLITIMNWNCESTGSNACNGEPFQWTQLDAIPDSVGFAGSFAGLSNSALLVAGGANFPRGTAPWNGGIKAWHRDVFGLDSANGKWEKLGQLPEAMGYGVSITTRDAVLLIGGSNEQGHSARVWKMRYEMNHVEFDSLPSLPFSLANAAGVLIGETIYIAGGLQAPDSLQTSSAFLSLNLAEPEKGWTVLPTWPGPSRMLAVAAVANGQFYLFSGTELVNGQRRYLQDAYRYDTSSGWTKLADLPRAAVAAPSPAWTSTDAEIFLFGGDDGALAATSSELREQHPGFNSEILAYSISANDWKNAGTIFTRKEANAITHPGESVWAPVTTSMVVWNNQLVFPGGEVRPATRTTRVLLASPCIP